MAISICPDRLFFLSVAMKITHQSHVARGVKPVRFAAVLSSAFTVLFAASFVLPIDGRAYAATQDEAEAAINPELPPTYT